MRAEDGTAVVVVGAGARTPLGFTLAASAAAVRAGIAGIADHPAIIDRAGLPMKVTRDPGLDIEVTGPERLARIAASAAREALAPLMAKGAGLPVSLMLATGEERPGGAQPGAVYSALRDALPEGLVTGGGVIAGGHAGGLVALMHARDALRSGRAQACLVGGADGYIEPETLEWLEVTDRLHSEENIYGFCPGEAAGFCLLTTLATARRLDLVPLLLVVEATAAREENRIGTETVCLGEGLGAALGALFQDAPEDMPPVDRILCDMNGERYRGNEYGFAVLRNLAPLRDAADFEAPADCWGDVGAASGPLHVGLVVEAERRGYSKGPLSLVWGSSEGGSRAAALLRRAGRS